MANSSIGGNAAKMVGEVILTGTSGLLDGNVKAGLGHTLLGFVGAALFGVTGLVLVKANSYSYSVSEKHLHQHVIDAFRRQPDTSEESAESA